MRPSMFPKTMGIKKTKRFLPLKDKNVLVQGSNGLTIHRVKPKPLKVYGKPIPRGMYKDSDGDGYPNPVDCEPHNPNKQGLGTAVGAATEAVGEKLEKTKFFGGAVKKYKDYKSRAPERREARHQERMDRLRIQQEEAREKATLQQTRKGMAEERMELSRKRLQLGSERAKASAERQKSMGAMPSMFGGLGQSSQPQGSAPPTMMSGFGNNNLPNTLVTPSPSISALQAVNKTTPTATAPKKRKKRRKKSKKKKK